MKWIVTLIAVLALAYWAYKRFSPEDLDKLISGTQESDFDKIYKATATMSYEELDEMHERLLPIVSKSLISGLAFYDDELSFEDQKQLNRAIDDDHGDKLPEKDCIYGCKTYDDASKLNQRIVKCMDLIDMKRNA